MLEIVCQPSHSSCESCAYKDKVHAFYGLPNLCVLEENIHIPSLRLWHFKWNHLWKGAYLSKQHAYIYARASLCRQVCSKDSEDAPPARREDETVQLVVVACLQIGGLATHATKRKVSCKSIQSVPQSLVGSAWLQSTLRSSSRLEALFKPRLWHVVTCYGPWAALVENAWFFCSLMFSQGDLPVE